MDRRKDVGTSALNRGRLFRNVLVAHMIIIGLPCLHKFASVGHVSDVLVVVHRVVSRHLRAVVFQEVRPSVLVNLVNQILQVVISFLPILILLLQHCQLLRRNVTAFNTLSADCKGSGIDTRHS